MKHRKTTPRSGLHRRQEQRSPRRRWFALTVVGVSMLALGQVSASAAASPPVTYEGPLYASTVNTSPSADKPQSKLWWNDGSWWALMLDSSKVKIHQLGTDHVWRNTGTVVDGRKKSTGDAMWTNDKLYVASRAPGSKGKVKVTRYSYSSSNQQYSKDSGFPVTVGGAGGAESVTMDRDSLGRLWLTFTRSSTVWVAHTTTSDSSWGQAFTIPGVDTTVKSDDISALVNLNGKIGVLWSDQQSHAFRFSVHNDTDPDSVWTSETPLEGSRIADDHLNLKSLLGDDQGRLYAAVKTSLGDDPADPATSPSIVVLTRSSSGTWTSAVAAQKSLDLTRPQLALDRTNRQLILLQSDEGGGSVYYKTAPLGSVTNASFNKAEKGAPFIQWSGASINNVSTTKDPVDATTGLVGIATDGDAHRYFHAEMSLGASSPPPDDTTAPTVVSTVPGSGDTGVPVGDPVTATFSEVLDASTVDGSSMSLTDSGGTAVPATVSYDAGAKKAVLTPSDPLAADTEYTAAVTTAMTDTAGNALEAPVSWSFTTAAASDGGGGSGEVTVPVTDDTYVSADDPSANFGSAGSLVVDGSPLSKGFLRYDLSAYAGRTVQAATLVVPVTDSGSTGQANFRLTNKDNWTESGLTYRNKPGLGTTIGRLKGTSPGTSYTVDLTVAEVQAALGSALSLGIATSSSNDLIIGTRESGSGIQLVLTLD